MNSITFFICFIPVLAILLLAINLIFAPHSPYLEKTSPFECGFHSFLGQNRTQFGISFFIFGILYTLFALEVVLFYPYAVSSHSNEGYGLAIALTFFFVLTLGFVFELGKKALTFDSRQLDNSDILLSKIPLNQKNSNKHNTDVSKSTLSIIIDTFKNYKTNINIISLIIIIHFKLFIEYWFDKRTPELFLDFLDWANKYVSYEFTSWSLYIIVGLLILILILILILRRFKSYEFIIHKITCCVMRAPIIYLLNFVFSLIYYIMFGIKVFSCPALCMFAEFWNLM